MREGISFPMGGGIFGSVMKPGFLTQGGVRALFFNPSVDAAWTVDLGVVAGFYDANNSSGGAVIKNFRSTTTNPATNQTTTNVLPSFNVTVSSVQDTVANLGFGREWYLWGNPECPSCEPRFRIGADVAGRYGSSKLVLVEIKHKTDVTAGIFGSVHADLEIPISCCLFQIGLRAEYGVYFNDILQSQNDTNMQTINLLVHLGLRF
jgi:hypothetical protein